MYVEFSDYKPPPRYTDTPWTRVRIDEAPSSTGEWKTIDTLVLDPIDPDPAEPMEREFGTANAQLVLGWYRIVWLDASDVEQYTVPVYDATEMRPSVALVGSLLHTRTTLRDTGEEIGTFDERTRPTGDAVEDLIDTAMGLITPKLPATIQSDLADLARHVVSLQTAILVETSYFPEQQEATGPLLEVLVNQLNSALTGLIDATHSNRPTQARIYSVPMTGMGAGWWPAAEELLP